MLGQAMMTTAVTITSRTATGSADALGRPTFTTSTRASVCRLVRKSTSTPDPNTDGLLVSTLSVYLPQGTGLKDSDRLTVGSEVYEVLGDPDAPTTPDGRGFETATVRLVKDAT